MDFWDRLKVEVKRNNTTQDWIAGKIGVSGRTFRGWVSRKIMPNADQAHALAQALGVTVEYLVTGSDSTDPWVREHRDLVEKLKRIEAEPTAFGMVADVIDSADRRLTGLGKASSAG
jgi:transcriptional regulator with XRE-family HTH domain